MATIIDCGDGRFIAGDPPENLPEGMHWCTGCAGRGVVNDIGWDDQLTLDICMSCDGTSTEQCFGPGCDTCDWIWHHRMDRLKQLIHDAKDRAKARNDMDEHDRLFARFMTMVRASRLRYGSITLDEARLEVLQDRFWKNYQAAFKALDHEEAEHQWLRYMATTARLEELEARS